MQKWHLHCRTPVGAFVQGFRYPYVPHTLLLPNIQHYNLFLPTEFYSLFISHFPDFRVYFRNVITKESIDMTQNRSLWTSLLLRLPSLTSAKQKKLPISSFAVYLKDTHHPFKCITAILWISPLWNQIQILCYSSAQQLRWHWEFTVETVWQVKYLEKEAMFKNSVMYTWCGAATMNQWILFIKNVTDYWHDS